MSLIYTYIAILVNFWICLSAVNIRCTFESYKYNINKSLKAEFQSCNVLNDINLNIRLRGEEIQNVIDKKYLKRQAPLENISRLSIKTETIWYLPKRIEIFFPKLNNLVIQHCEMKEITQDDLKVFPELLYLYLEYNDIQVLEKDLFKYNPKLYYVDLKGNDIDYIDSNILDLLSNLNIFDMRTNKCVSDVYNSERLEEFKQAIADYCQKTDEIIQKAEIVTTEIKRGKYFWILVVCGVIVGVFFIFAGIVFVNGALKVYKSGN